MSETKDKPVSTSRKIVNATIKPEVQKIELNSPSIIVTVNGTPDAVDRGYIYPSE